MPEGFYFAWVADGSVAFDGNVHNVEDLTIYNLTISHDEGDFAQAVVDVENPRVGLLAPGRNVWAWISYYNGATITPLMKGRLVGLPSDLQDELIQLTFIARPDNYETQKLALAETLKERPYWDPIWFSPETLADPDNVLEARSAAWHVDRLTHVVTISDIARGEDGNISWDASVPFYDSVKVSLNAAPARRVFMNASVNWDQNAAGTLDLSYFCASGAPYSILTYTGAGMLQNWPKPGARVGGGWTVYQGGAVRVDGLSVAQWGYEGRAGDGNGFYSSFEGEAPEHSYKVTLPAWATESSFGVFGPGGFQAYFPAHVFRLPRWRVSASLVLRYDVSRKKSETLSFVLESDVQSIVTEPGDEETIDISMSSGEIASPVDPGISGGGALPIGDVKNAVYFSGPRGAQSIEFLICKARAALLFRARAVKVEVEVPWADALAANLSCRKNLQVADARLPGGTAVGKIVAYTLSVDGGSGSMTGHVTIACCIGKGNTVSASDGTPTYVDDGYVNTGYQRYEGAFVMPVVGEIAYEDIQGLPANDDGVDFNHVTHRDFVQQAEILGDADMQEAALAERALTAETPSDLLAALDVDDIRRMAFHVRMRTLVGGPFETLFNPEVSQLMIPKHIDLEAPSA